MKKHLLRQFCSPRGPDESNGLAWHQKIFLGKIDPGTKNPQRVAQRIAQRNSQRIPQRIPQWSPQWIPQRIPPPRFYSDSTQILPGFYSDSTHIRLTDHDRSHLGDLVSKKLKNTPTRMCPLGTTEQQICKFLFEVFPPGETGVLFFLTKARARARGRVRGLRAPKVKAATLRWRHFAYVVHFGTFRAFGTQRACLCTYRPPADPFDRGARPAVS